MAELLCDLYHAWSNKIYAMFAYDEGREMSGSPTWRGKKEQRDKAEKEARYPSHGKIRSRRGENKAFRN